MKIKYTKEDKEWAIAIKDKFHNKCIVCGGKERLNAHHIIPRQNKKFKHDMRNGLALCPKCHRFSFVMSAHQNPFQFYRWLEKKYPKIIKDVEEMKGGQGQGEEDAN